MSFLFIVKLLGLYFCMGYTVHRQRTCDYTHILIYKQMYMQRNAHAAL